MTLEVVYINYLRVKMHAHPIKRRTFYQIDILITDQLCLGPHKAQCLPRLETSFTLEHFSSLKPFLSFLSYLKLGHLRNFI